MGVHLKDMRADCAKPLALELVGAVRNFDQQGVRDILAVADLPALAVVLAAMVDDERSERELLGWLPETQGFGLGRPPKRPPTPRGGLQPCGTHAAWTRHRSRGEEPCEACWVGEREYQRSRPGRRAGDRAKGAA